MALLVNSHYKIPWIVWKREYQFSVPYGEYRQVEFAHGLPFTPLLIGQWSTNANFNPSYDLSVEVPGGATGGQTPFSLLTSANATNIRIVADNNATQGSQTFYLRLMAFAPPDYTGDVSPVGYSSKFRYNSHYNYQKIFRQGLASANQVVSHDLGYLPQARVWSVVNGFVYPDKGILTTTILKQDGDSQYYYHVYKDKME